MSFAFMGQAQLGGLISAPSSPSLPADWAKLLHCSHGKPTRKMGCFGLLRLCPSQPISSLSILSVKASHQASPGAEAGKEMSLCTFFIKLYRKHC